MTAFWLWAMAMAAANGAGGMIIDGSATCPTATEVALRFSTLSGPSAMDSGVRAWIEMAEDGVEIVLRRAEGALIGRRRIPAQGTCDERARIAAIVLATWESDVHPAFERPPMPTPSSPPPAPADDIVKPMPPTVPDHRKTAWDVGVGVSSSVAGGAFVAGARLAAAFMRPSGIGAQLTVGGEGDRSTAAGAGQAVWSRITAGAGPAYRRQLGAWAIDASFTVVAALFRVHGEQYPISYQSSGWDGGVSAGVRLIAPGRAWRPWLAIDATRWLDTRVVQDEVSGQTPEVPPWMASASLGFSFFGR